NGVVAEGTVISQHATQQYIELVLVSLVKARICRTALPAYQQRGYPVILVITLPGVQVPRYFPALGFPHVLIDRGCTSEFQSLNPWNPNVDLTIGLEIVPLVAIISCLVCGYDHGVLSIFDIGARHTVGPECRFSGDAPHQHTEDGTRGLGRELPVFLPA